MKFPEQYRWQKPGHPYHSQAGDQFGAFALSGREANGRPLQIIAADGEETGWEHVSVTLIGSPSKCPSWEEMCLVKRLFWDDEEAVMQLHPPVSEYVNNHPGCLHLWRPIKGVPLPPSILVGVKANTLSLAK